MVDAFGKVLGTTGLYVADASAAPDHPEATTMAPAYLIAANIVALLQGQ